MQKEQYGDQGLGGNSTSIQAYFCFPFHLPLLPIFFATLLAYLFCFSVQYRTHSPQRHQVYRHIAARPRLHWRSESVRKDVFA